jgi:hypothetical protein
VTTAVTTEATAVTIETTAGRTAATAGSTSAVRRRVADAFQVGRCEGAPFCSSAMWCPNITDLSERYRVCAADVIDQGGKHVPTQPTNFPANRVRSSQCCGS